MSPHPSGSWPEITADLQIHEKGPTSKPLGMKQEHGAAQGHIRMEFCQLKGKDTVKQSNSNGFSTLTYRYNLNYLELVSGRFCGIKVCMKNITKGYHNQHSWL